MPCRSFSPPEPVTSYQWWTSTSFAEPELFGDRLSEFDSAVRTALASYSDTDTFIEDNEFLIHIGRRGQA